MVHKPSSGRPMSPPEVNLPVTLAVRELISVHLDSAAEACRRLKDPHDAEALHDFRVALRRLRSLARAYKPFLHEYLPVKLRRRVKSLAAGTGVARDREVQIAWINDRIGQVGPHERVGYQWVIGRLATQLDAEYEAIRKHLPQRFKRLRKRIDEHLVQSDDGNSPAYGVVAAGLLMTTGED